MKKNVKWIAAAAATLALSATLAVAAPGDGHGWGGGDHGRREQGAKLAEKLNLTDAQKQQWETLQQNFRQENATFLQQARQTIDAFRAAKEAGDNAKADSLKPQVDAQRAQMKQLRDAQEQKFVRILTTEQRAKFDAMKAERAQRRAEHDKQN
jgi:Spy/CpxP family protein refolding chaperone